MANVKFLQRAFGGGEVTPEFFGRIDDVKYQTGLAKCRNFVIKPHGPAENRAGFEFVNEVKHSNQKVRLLPFTFSTTQTMVIEMGAGYFRFHTNGGTLLHNGTPYEVSNPYAEDDLFDIHYVQSADVLTLVHPKHEPRELRRLGATNWQLQIIDFDTPDFSGALTLTKSGGSEEKYDYRYVVTFVKDDLITESFPSASKSIKANLYEVGQVIKISWPAQADAAHYNVYKEQGGLYGFIGQTSSTSMEDDDIDADMSKTPPKYEATFDGSDKYPGAVSYFEQRRCFAGTNNEPQTIWMTKSGTESDLTFALPLRADDRIKFRVAAREANTIRHIVPLNDLLLFTSSAEWRVTSLDSDAVTPTSISVRPQSYVGANNVQPVIINNTVIYVAARGGHAREIGYSDQAGGYITGDLSLRAPHLFDNEDVVDVDYAKAPLPIVWMVSTSGLLLGFTYVPEQRVGAWHWHDTDGKFESIAVVAEGREDALYAVVQREIDGVSKRYVERMHSRQFEDQADAFFVDCGATYDGAPTKTISGLSYLEGKTVNILTDGAVHPQREVINGTIELDNEASKVQVGLPIFADLQTLPVSLALEDGSFGQGRFKNINRTWLRVYRSSGIFVGPDADSLVEAKQRTTEPYGTPPVLKSEEIEIVLRPKWDDGGQIYVRQYDPLPLTIVSMTLEVSLG